jgi:type II secretory pathway predicted ATPase ExeA
MSNAALAALGFTEEPFAKDIPDAELWLPPSKAELVATLVEALQERTSVMLIGEAGVGKTCVLRALRHALPSAGFRLTYCHNATLGRRDFYRQLGLALGLTSSSTAASLFYSISTHIEELAKERAHSVLLLDESHLLHQDVLDHLHILCNFGWDSRPLLSLILVGLPELRDRLALRRNRSIASRLQHRLEVGPLVPADSADYLRVRMKRAGCDREVFSEDAVALLHEATGGAMRNLDRLASAALRDAARRKRRVVERDLIARVIEADQRDYS